MKITVKKYVDRKVARTLAEECKIAVDLFIEQHVDESDTCYDADDLGYEITADHTGVRIGVFYPDNETVDIWSTTCGGTLHSLSVNVNSGLLMLSHEGRRKSTPDTLLQILPPAFEAIQEGENWEIVPNSLKTSEPTWGIWLGLMPYPIKEGPHILEDQIESEE